MDALENPFLDALAAKEIEGAFIEGVNKSGKRYSKCMGNRTLLDGPEKPMMPKDILFLASATKLVTAIATLQCCEKGLLKLDEDLRPEWFADDKVLLNWNDDEPEPTYGPIEKPLTLRHLLTHSSGSVYHFFNPAILRWRNATPLPDGKTLTPSKRFKQPLAFQPGTAWLYGAGLDLAGPIIEKASGMRLDEYFRTNILEPLGIAREDFSFAPVTEGLGDRMVDLNPKDPKGEGLGVGMGTSVHVDEDTSCYGGHGGYCTAEAYLAILQSILLDDEKLLSHESVKLMFEPQLEPGAKTNLNELLNAPGTSFFAQNTTSANRDYGLSGLLITEDDDGSGLSKGSMTWGGGINSVWFIDRVRGSCGFAAPQMGLPVNMGKAMELKVVFRKEMSAVLDN